MLFRKWPVSKVLSFAAVLYGLFLLKEYLKIADARGKVAVLKGEILE